MAVEFSTISRRSGGHFTSERNCPREIPVLIGASFFVLIASPALASNLNAIRRAHKLPPLAHSATLAAAAYEHAHDLARRACPMLRDAHLAVRSSA